MVTIEIGKVELIQLEDFSKLQKVEGNRPLTKKVKELMREIKQFGQITPVTVVVDSKKKWWLLDGQHRLAACEALGLPLIAYIRKNGIDKLPAIISAQTSHSWTVSNHIDSHCELGDVHYLKFKELQTLYSNIDDHVLYQIVSGNNPGKYDKIVKQNALQLKEDIDQDLLQKVNEIVGSVWEQRKSLAKFNREANLPGISECRKRDFSELVHKFLTTPEVDYTSFRKFIFMRAKELYNGSNIMYTRFMLEYKQFIQL